MRTGYHLRLTGPIDERDRFVGAIIRAGGPDYLFTAHLTEEELATSEQWLGETYIESVSGQAHTPERTDIWFGTYATPATAWLQRISGRFPSVCFEFVCGSIHDGYVRYTRMQAGQAMVDEVSPDDRASQFLAPYGWDGWWNPVGGEDLSDVVPAISDFEGAEEEPPSMGDVVDEEAARPPAPDAGPISAVAPLDIEILEFHPDDSPLIGRNPFAQSGGMRWEFESQDWWDSPEHARFLRELDAERARREPERDVPF